MDAIAAPTPSADVAPTNPALDAQNPDAIAGGAPPPKPRPESPLTYDETLGKWVAKTKVDGTERVVPWEDLHRDAQQARSAQERYEEAKEIKRRNADLDRAARAYREALTNPQKAYAMWQAQGLDPNAMLEQMYEHAAAEAKLTPEQRELRAYREQQAQIEEQHRQAEERAREEADAAAQAAVDAKYDRAFASHMTKLGVPEDPMLRGHLSHMLWAMHDRASAEGKKMPLGDAVGEAIGSMKGITKSVISMMSPEERVSFLGPEIVAQLAQARVAGAAPIPAPVPNGGPARDDSGRFSRYTPFRSGTNPFGRLDK
jgi:hypothetical protein